MAKESFGKTWWGAAWIDALEKNSYPTELLEEGKTFAIRGNVLNLRTYPGNITAVVQETENNYYKVNLNLQTLSPDEKDKVKNIISLNPAVASELSLGNFPFQLFENADKYGIKLIPADWSNIISTCSCNSSQNPCEHIAAVYYILAGEIDKNPFLIFKLRDMSSESVMNSSGMVLKHDNNGNGVFNHIPFEDIRLQPSENLPKDIDLSFTDLKIKSIFKLLPDNPLFFKEENFKLILIEKYRALSSFVGTFNIEYTKIDLSKVNFFLVEKYYTTNNGSKIPSRKSYFLFTHEYYIRQINAGQEFVNVDLPMLYDDGVKIEPKKMKEAETEDILSFFLSLPFNINPAEISPSAMFLNLAASIALSLVKTYSFIPEVITEISGRFWIKYIPLIHDKKTSDAVEYLKNITPVNFYINLADRTALEGNLHLHVLSLFISYLVHLHNRKYGRNYYFSEQKVYNTFFRGDFYKIEKYEEENTSKIITDWLERISFHKRDIRLVIVISNSNHEHFTVNIEIEKKKNGNTAIPLSDIFQGNNNFFNGDIEIIRTEIAREIKIASEYFPPLAEILNNRGGIPAHINSEDMFEFLSSTLDTLRLLGIKVNLPEKIQNLPTPKVIITAQPRKETEQGVSYFSLSEILEFNWQVAIGEKIISADEFRKLAESTKGIVNIGDTYFLLDPDEVKNILNSLSIKNKNISSKEALQLVLTGEYKGVPFQPEESIKQILENLMQPEDIQLPSGLNAVLRPYQERGYKWLYSNTIKGLGSCLADDMGLGKTIQVITVLLKLKEEGNLQQPALVICPTTLVGNWQKECEKFSPGLRVFIYHGSKRKLITRNTDLIITSYGTIRNDYEKFSQREWPLVIIDEAQNIKNPDTEQTRCVKKIQSTKYIAMSGTPVENRLTELWSIFDFINEGYLGSLGSFKRNYSLPIEKYRDKEKIERLRKITSPFILRRLKTDLSIINDLPEKFIFNEYCYLSKEQTLLYDELVKTTLDEIKENTGIQRRGLIFKLITSLKQICNHPSHYTKEEIYSKELSGKAESLIGLLEIILDCNQKALVFTQYKEMGDILQQIIKNEFNFEPLFFHGSLSREVRDKFVKEFQEIPENKIMVVSLKAGGTGLNLTSATNVIHYDLWWNPAVEDQATDRTYRIGQEQNVMVHRMITLGTFEEKIDEMLNLKKELANITITEGENWITELSDKELRELFVPVGKPD